MRSGAALIAVVLLASSAGADTPGDPLARAPAAPADPFAVLREPGRSWTYQTTVGESLSTLVAPPQGFRWRCEVKPWTAQDALGRSSIVCDIPTAPDGPDSGVEWTMWLVFDDTGVRQIDERDTDVRDRSKTLALTFPRKLDGTWKMDEKGRDGLRVRVIVREETATVLGVARKVWVAESERWQPPVAGQVLDPDRQLVQLVPGLGPVLMCRKGPPGSAYNCLRLIEHKPPPPEARNPPEARRPPEEIKPAPPAGRVSISSKQAHDVSTLKAGDVAGKLAAAYLGGVRRCYLAALAKRPAVRGALTLGFTVNAVGRTTAISVKGFDDAVAGCVAKQAADWRFPIPQSTYAEPRNARFTVGLALAP